MKEINVSIVMCDPRFPQCDGGAVIEIVHRGEKVHVCVDSVYGTIYIMPNGGDEVEVKVEDYCDGLVVSAVRKRL